MTNLQIQNERTFRPDVLTIGAITASFAFIMELTLVPLILSAIKDALALSVVELAWVFNSYAIALAVAVLCCGLAGDFLDKRKLFMFGIALFSLGSVLSALSSDLSFLVLSRSLQGIGGGLFFPLVPVLLTQANADRAGKILMIWGGLSGFAAALLPLFGSALLAAIGWPAVFLAFAFVSSLAFVFVALGESAIESDGPRRAPDYRQLLSIRGYWLLLFYIFLTYGCFSFYLFHFTIRWHASGFDEATVSILLLCVWIAFAVVSFLLRNRVEGQGLNRSLLAAPGLIGLSFLVALIDSASLQFQGLSAILIGTGLACCNSPSTHLLLRKSPKDLRATSSSLDIIFARCGSVAMVALFATLSSLWVILATATLALVAICIAHAFLRASPIPD